MRRPEKAAPYALWQRIRPIQSFVVVAAALMLAGCATAPEPADTEAVAEYHQANDPMEPLNRGIFTVNQALDTMLLEPAAVMYKEFTPPIFQTGVNNFLNNLRSPVILANDLFQGDLDRAGTTLVRFLINTTIGVAGLGDPASSFGFERHEEDFGQTLGVWGTGEGPYLMLPILGPSNPRDAVGRVVDFLLDPLNWWAANTDREWISYSRAVMTGVDFRARNYDLIEDLEKSSLDYYAALRSLYRQRRTDEIRNGASTATPGPGVGTIPEFKDPETSSTK